MQKLGETVKYFSEAVQKIENIEIKFNMLSQFTKCQKDL